MADRTRRIAVIGAGVSGLTLAYRLQQQAVDVEVVLLERSDRVGAQLRTVEVAGLSLDAGADSFLGRKPWASDLCRELGIQTTRAAATGTFLWTPRGLVEYPTGTAFGIPSDLGDLFRWPGLSGRGRRRAALDLVKRKRPTSAGDESLGSLLRRRLGDEATDLALAPILGQPFGGRIDELSTDATFPELRRWERSQGSLLRGAQAAVRDARKGTPSPPMFVRPRGGAQALTDELATRLDGSVRLGTGAEIVGPAGDGWVIRTSGGPVQADAVAVAVDAPVVRQLLGPISPRIEDELADIPSVGVGVVVLVYQEGTAERVPAGAGFAAPAGATPMNACTFTSSVWPDPAFGSRAVLRCAIGGAGQEDVLDADDHDIVDACARHLAALIPLPSAPAASAVVRWPAATPRYRLGHLERVAAIRERLPAGIFVCGRSFDGVDVAECIRGATQTADDVRNFLASDRRERIG